MQAVRNLNLRIVDPRRKIQDSMLRRDELWSRLIQASEQILQIRKLRLEKFQGRLPDPNHWVELRKQKLLQNWRLLNRTMKQTLRSSGERLAAFSGMLDSLSH